MHIRMKNGLALGVLAAVVATTAACEDFLGVRTPNTIAAESVDPLEDAGTFSHSAWQNYLDALSDFAVYTGWFTNELRVGDTFPTRNEVGRRFIDDRNGTMTGVWSTIARATASAEDALVLLDELPEDNIHIARLYLTAGFAAVNMAEAYCTGVIRQGPGAPSPELSRAQMLDHAITRLEQAVSAGTANGSDEGLDIADAARVGLARAHLFAGNNGQVAAAVSGVDPDFVYEAVFIDDPSSRGRLGNTVYAFSGRAATRESGVVGPEWRALGLGVDESEDAPFAAEEPGDARVRWYYDGRLAQDGVHEYVLQTTHDGWGAPLPVASGLEARYLVEQAVGDDVSRLALINERRAANDLGGFASTDPDEILEELLHQKGRDFWLTSRRMGDWRWYTGDGSISRSTPFRFIIGPDDDYYKPEVGAMGDQVCWPLPYEEYSRNPDIDR